MQGLLIGCWEKKQHVSLVLTVGPWQQCIGSHHIPFMSPMWRYEITSLKSVLLSGHFYWICSIILWPTKNRGYMDSNTGKSIPFFVAKRRINGQTSSKANILWLWHWCVFCCLISFRQQNGQQTTYILISQWNNLLRGISKTIITRTTSFCSAMAQRTHHSCIVRIALNM